MAKITTTIVISQGSSSVDIDERYAFFHIDTIETNQPPEDILIAVEDIENVIEAFKKHITDTH